MLANEVFSYCESELSDFSKRIGGNSNILENVLGENEVRSDLKIHRKSKRICKNNYLDYQPVFDAYSTVDSQMLANADK